MCPVEAGVLLEPKAPTGTGLAASTHVHSVTYVQCVHVPTV